jgi:putative flippase GtrA
VTFGASIRHSHFVSYLLIQSIGGLINLGCYSALILGPLVDWPIFALIVGSALATISNFLLVRKFVYRFRSALTDQEV